MRGRAAIYSDQPHEGASPVQPSRENEIKYPKNVENIGVL